MGAAQEISTDLLTTSRVAGHQPDFLDEALRRYQFTTEKPTSPGWYWYRFDQDSSERTTEVRYVSDVALQNQILLGEGEWAGPLEPLV